MEKEISINISYKNGETESYSTWFHVDSEDELLEAIDNMRTGKDGSDVSEIDYISMWDNEGNSY